MIEKDKYNTNWKLKDEIRSKELLITPMNYTINTIIKISVYEL